MLTHFNAASTNSQNQLSKLQLTNNKYKLHDVYNCTDTSHFSSALFSATVPPPLVL